ncbi:MAG: hypothetical protein HFG89_04005 [Dorea sp.]|jgi:hypothetical protein|nr:hypothetical protein [Dorea sp.]
MRNKKILSTVVASALAATTMAVPVMAADGGNIDVPVTTKTAVIRVQVPTKMDISVNQFEMGDGGSQIYSTPFDMINRSEIPVKISVTSTAELKATTKLVGTKADAESSKTEGEVWMAVAAETAADSYADGAATAIKDLTDENKNVTSFVQGTDADAAKGTANQTFYMDKSGTMKYKLLNSNEAAADIEYAQFYELTLQTVAGADALAALIAENDVYVAAGAAADGQDLTKEAKGTAHTYDAGEKYYTAALEATAKGDVDSTKLYVYGNGDAATDGVAAFRYIGKLSGAQETWTKDDITKVSIKYDILGVQESKYNDVKADCVYGLYAAVKGPQVSITENGLITVSSLTAENNFKSLTITDKTGKVMEWNIAPAEWNTDNWDATNGGTFTVQLGEQWISYLISQGGTAEVTVTLKDDSTINSGVVTVTQ